MPLHYVRNTDPGAPALTGEVGTFLAVLDEALILGRLFTTADDTTFTDRSAEARLDGGTAFALFPTMEFGNRAYFGMSVKFSQLIFNLDTPGQGGAYVWEYWNGAAWQSLTVTDGTNEFSQDGIVSWTPPANWTTRTLNGQTRYWVRVRPLSLPTTNPTVLSVSTLGWLRAFEGPNKAAYKQAPKTGRLQMFLRVVDDGSGEYGAREAYLQGYESMTDVDTGTNAFGGDGWRKSASLDATARPYIILADGRTVMMFCQRGSYTGVWQTLAYFGDIYSYTPGDQYGVALIAGPSGNYNPYFGYWRYSWETINGHFLARASSGVAGAAAVGKFVDYVRAGATGNDVIGYSGLTGQTNAADGRIHMGRIWVTDGAPNTTRAIRGHLRGVWVAYHPASAFNDGDTWQGVDDIAARQFRMLRPFHYNSGGGLVLEISDTWDSD